ncbi:hypothetical protein [Klebsiella quasipneumoniae]|uniref:hypothetical protein n=1 Tax=Klebsiella quasipneumoniae TaxID=1463165 RepID=UPI001D10259E|nr:hypothetical protein [Klebsiella quasipneumoniae]
MITNAAELRAYLQESLGCEITRTGMDYISIKPEGYPKAVRLRESYMEHLGPQKAQLSERLKLQHEQALGEVEKLAKAVLDELKKDLKSV